MQASGSSKAPDSNSKARSMKSLRIIKRDASTKIVLQKSQWWSPNLSLKRAASDESVDDNARTSKKHASGTRETLNAEKKTEENTPPISEEKVVSEKKLVSLAQKLIEALVEAPNQTLKQSVLPQMLGLETKSETRRLYVSGLTYSRAQIAPPSSHHLIIIHIPIPGYHERP